MNYEIFGPFELPRAKPRHFTHKVGEKQEFWNDLDEEYPGLPEACGCYIVSVRNRVWYVGMAQKQSFRGECFTADKILKIERAMDYGKGNAFLTLIARHTENGHFSKRSVNGYTDIRDLELLLIESALDRNGDLLNSSATKVLREMIVPGFLNSPLGAGKRTSVKAFQQIMGI
jgi:hypothetical protein